MARDVTLSTHCRLQLGMAVLDFWEEGASSWEDEACAMQVRYVLGRVREALYGETDPAAFGMEPGGDESARFRRILVELGHVLTA